MEAGSFKYNTARSDRDAWAVTMDGMLPFGEGSQDIWCGGCRAFMPCARFSKNRRQKSGYQNYCKDCMRAIYTRPENLERRRVWRLQRPVQTLLIETRSRAKAVGVSFDLTEDDLAIPVVCPVVGCELRWDGNGRTDQSPSVDRIDPTKGYVRGNVAVISWLANRIKSNCSDPAVFEAIAAYLRRHQSQ